MNQIFENYKIKILIMGFRFLLGLFSILVKLFPSIQFLKLYLIDSKLNSRPTGGSRKGKDVIKEHVMSI